MVDVVGAVRQTLQLTPAEAEPPDFVVVGRPVGDQVELVRQRVQVPPSSARSMRQWMDVL
jgi:hypothetical protein